jgi:hypothetical protein
MYSKQYMQYSPDKSHHRRQYMAPHTNPLFSHFGVVGGGHVGATRLIETKPTTLDAIGGVHMTLGTFGGGPDDQLRDNLSNARRCC